MFLHKNVGFFSQLPILYFRQVTVIPTISYQNDPYLNYVVLNINGDTALSGNNNTFLDSGFRGLSSTGSSTGNVTQGTFSPFSPAGWSGYFNGSSDITLPDNPAWDVGGNYTLEFWFNCTEDSALNGSSVRDACLVSQSESNTVNWSIMIRGDSTTTGTKIGFNAGNVVVTESTASIPKNVWHHFALVTNGSTATIYLNGINVASGAYTTTINYSALLSIGRLYNITPDTYRNYFIGYISNLRIVKGTALYTTNFTPNSAEPLKLLPNTSLLTLQDNRFKDNSRNNFTLSATGTPQIQPFSPIAPAVDYTPSLHGGSAYFDGSVNSYLTSTHASAFILGTIYTVELWVYPNVVTGTQGLILLAGAFNFRLENDVPTLDNANTSNTGPAGGKVIAKSWNHISISCNGTNTLLFVNGNLVSTYAGTTGSIYSPTTAWIGLWNNLTNPLNGYISNLRIVKGQAVYTSNFTPPSRPVTATSNGGASVGTTAVPNLSVTPSLLLDFDNGGIIDRSYKNDALVFGDTKTQTLSSKFGTGSLYFDGTGDYLKVDRYLDLNASQWTIETWFNLVDVAGATNETLINFQPHCTITFIIRNSALSFYIGNGTTWLALDRISSSILSSNRWHHAALVRNGNRVTSYIDGVSAATTPTTPSGFNGSAYIGTGFSTSVIEPLNGCIEDFRITKGVARYTGASFTPPPKLQANNSDPYYSNVVLFLDGNNIGSNVNNEFRATAGDAARLAITRTGATQGSFSPFIPNGWSGFFNGSSYLTVPANAAFSLNGDFTIECWINTSVFSLDTNVRHIISMGTGADAANLLKIFIGNASGVSTDKIQVFSGSTGYTGVAAITVADGKWHHIAVTRSGNQLKTFVDGLQDGATATTAQSFDAGATSNIQIGRINIGESGRFNGFLANLRIVKGQALYTNTFTPPTGPLPSLSGSGFSTSLLTLQDNRFKDNSPNNFTLSVGAGTPSVQAFNPYKQSTAYSPTLHGGSGYFDGSSYLTVPANQAFNLDGDFTIECWVNTSVFNVESIYTRHLITMGTGADAANLLKVALLTTAGAASNVISLYTTSAILVGNIVVADGRWHHIAVTRSGTNLRLYVDGVQSGSTTTTSQSFNAGATTNIQIGRYNNAEAGRWNGYISNLRIVKGRALYTSNFTPPTSPVTAVNGTSLLLNFDNGYAIDSTGNNVITTVGDSRTDVLNTAPLSSSTGSLYFDGTGDYLTIPTNPNLALGSGDFTVEFWVNILGTGLQHFLDWRTADNESNRFVIFYSNGNVDIYVGGSAKGFNRPLSPNTWNHVALVKNSNITRMFVNGLSSTVTYTDTNTYLEPTNGLRMGLNWNNVGPLTGYLDDIRITKGIARYTSNFTPQTYENPTSNLLTYPTDPFRNLVVLDLNADTVNNEQNNTFLDRSGNNLTITRSGSTTQGSFSPFSPAGWSGYFDSTNYLSIANTTALNLASSPFTIEAWIYRMADAAPPIVQVFVGKRIGTNPYPISYYLGTDITNALLFFTDGGLVLSGGFLPKNQWTHIAVSYNGTQGSLYVNGNSVSGPATFSVTEQNVPIYIGYYPTEPTSIFKGYISNLRIVKGQALYTNPFTPPTAALTTTSTVGGVTLSAENVALLTLQDNRFKDNSNNNLTITPNGTPSVKPFSPFQPTATYSPTVHGGSGYFNGALTSYLSIAGNTVFNFGSSNWTVQAWVYLNAMPTSDVWTGGSWANTMVIAGVGTPFASDGLDCIIGQTKLLVQSSENVYTSTVHGITINTWNHLAYVRDGNNIFFYVNGVAKGSAAFTGSVGEGSGTYIGCETSNGAGLNGYISNLRVVRGVAITPPVGGPTAPVQAVSGTSLLLNFDNAGVVDSTGKNNVTTYSTSKVDYANLKYGSGALKFNGTTDYMQVGTASDWTFLHSPSAKWTIEFWVYSNISTSIYLLDTANDNATSNAGIGIQKDASNKIRCYIARAAATLVLDATSTPTVPLSTWTHVAITYDHSLASNNMVMYFNGLSSNVFTTVNAPVTINPANALSIGCNGNGAGNFFNGAIDELRITNAVRYTGNFSVSSYTLPLSS